MQNLLPKSILKRSLEHHLNTPEEIMNTRINFLRNYCALAIGCYILGIGDRHLDNFLINSKTCEIFAIDFGFSFGQAFGNMIPELVPFRLTPQIRNIISPLGIKGIIRQTLVDIFAAFKNGKHKILDYCDVFVKEPLLDWTKNKFNKNKKKLMTATISNINNSAVHLNLKSGNFNMNSGNESNIVSENSEIFKSHKWIPLQKLLIIDFKLSNFNPIFVNLEEFKDTMHDNEVNLFDIFFNL